MKAFVGHSFNDKDIQFVRDIKDFVESAQIEVPNIWASCYPRRILPPNGYVNPKIYAGNLTCCTLMWDRPELDLLPHVSCALTSLLQTQMTVPTYFIRNEFAQAVANTNLPLDFKLSELRWPLDAMLFVLPDSFVFNYFGLHLPFLAISRCPANTYPTDDQRKRAANKQWELGTFNKVHNPSDRMLLHFPCYFQKSLPCDYSGSWPLSLDLSAIKEAQFVDATLYERSLHPYLVDPTPDMATPAQEKELQNKMTVFAIKLMLAFTARPHVIKNGICTREQKMKKGGGNRDALWSPNLVGWDYVIRRSNGDGLGTHASPRMHWRPGHFTHQFVGKRKDPNFVPADALPRKEKEGTIDWDKIEPAVQEAFWRNHELRWLDPILAGGTNE